MILEELKYRWSLSKLQRGRAKTDNSFQRKWRDLLKAKGDRNARDELRSSHQFEMEEWDEEINQLTTQFLGDQARILQVPLPPFDDDKAWFESKMFGFRLLTPDGVKTARADIRAEQKGQWDYWQTRITLVGSIIGIIGGLMGALAYFKAPPHP